MTGQNDRAIVSRGVCWKSDGDIVGDLDTGAGDPGGRPGSGLDAVSAIVPFTSLAGEQSVSYNKRTAKQLKSLLQAKD